MTIPNPHFILPPGTQVVIRTEARGPDGKPVHPRGAVAIILQSPADAWHSYRVRFLDNFEATFTREDLAILSHFKSPDGSDHAISVDPLQEHNLYDRVIYRCIVGSRAYGLDDDESDTDRRGIYLPPADLHWSLFGVPEQLENPDTEEVYWELQKFIVLALKANPNILECLYTPLIEHASPLAQDLLSMRNQFLSKLVYQTYNGYVASQFKKLQQDLRNKGEAKPKHVMHLIRLLLAGIETLTTGVVPVHVGPHREQLLKIKRNEILFEEANAWRLDLHKQFDEAYAKTNLPDRPNYALANEILLKARRSALQEK